MWLHFTQPSICSNISTSQTNLRRQDDYHNPLKRSVQPEFRQGKKKAAKTGPVFITDRGKPAYVLLTFDEYKRISCGRTRIADLLAMPGIEILELETPRLDDLAQTANLS